MSELRAGAGLRVRRGLVGAVVASGLGLLAHVEAGGLLPSVPWLAVTFATVAAVAICSAGVPAGLLRLVALVACGQFVTQLMLTALAGHAGDHPISVAASPPPPDVADRLGPAATDSDIEQWTSRPIRKSSST